MDCEHLLDLLSITELLSAIGSDTYLSGACRRNRGILLQALLQLPESVQVRVQNVVRRKKEARDRVRDGAVETRRVCRRLGQDETTASDITTREDEFLLSPTSNIIDHCYAQFYDSTNNAAMSFVVCAVCALWLRHVVAQPSLLEICNIPNHHRLVPSREHVAHVLTHGLLLEQAGIVREDGREKAILCHNCLTALQSSSPHPPRYSLANDLWIGDCPAVIRRLSIPELFLIARKFPRIYVIKLFAKSRRGHPDTLQRALKGNVTTFDLNAPKINDMLNGHLMPHLPQVLSSVLSICYIGSQSLS